MSLHNRFQKNTSSSHDYNFQSPSTPLKQSFVPLNPILPVKWIPFTILGVIMPSSQKGPITWENPSRTHLWGQFPTGNFEKSHGNSHWKFPLKNPIQWIGLRENWNRKTPWSSWENHSGFRWRFSQQNQSIDPWKSLENPMVFWDVFEKSHVSLRKIPCFHPMDHGHLWGQRSPALPPWQRHETRRSPAARRALRGRRAPGPPGPRRRGGHGLRRGGAGAGGGADEAQEIRRWYFLAGELLRMRIRMVKKLWI